MFNYKVMQKNVVVRRNVGAVISTYKNMFDVQIKRNFKVNCNFPCINNTCNENCTVANNL